MMTELKVSLGVDISPFKLHERFLKGKATYHCNTKKKAKKLLKALKLTDIKWSGGNEITTKTYWGEYKENTYYEISRYDGGLCCDNISVLPIIEIEDDIITLIIPTPTPPSSELNSDTFKLFLDGKVVVQCDTEEKADRLLFALGLLDNTWNSCGKLSQNHWELFKEKTCYSLAFGLGLEYSYYKYYEKEYPNIPIIKM